MLLFCTTVSCSGTELFSEEKELATSTQTQKVQQRFDNVALDIMTFEGPVNRYARDFEALTGATINLKIFPFPEVHDAIFQDLGSKTNQYGIGREAQLAAYRHSLGLTPQE